MERKSAGLEPNFDDDTDEVQFGGHKVALTGIISGVIIAVGVPSVAIIFRGNMMEATVIFLSLVALIIGGGVAGIAAFFGSVIPAFVKSKGGKKKQKTDEVDENK